MDRCLVGNEWTEMLVWAGCRGGDTLKEGLWEAYVLRDGESI